MYIKIFKLYYNYKKYIKVKHLFLFKKKIRAKTILSM